MGPSARSIARQSGGSNDCHPCEQGNWLRRSFKLRQLPPAAGPSGAWTTAFTHWTAQTQDLTPPPSATRQRWHQSPPHEDGGKVVDSVIYTDSAGPVHLQPALWTAHRGRACNCSLIRAHWCSRAEGGFRRLRWSISPDIPSAVDALTQWRARGALTSVFSAMDLDVCGGFLITRFPFLRGRGGRHCAHRVRL